MTRRSPALGAILGSLLLALLLTGPLPAGAADSEIELLARRLEAFNVRLGPENVELDFAEAGYVVEGLSFQRAFSGLWHTPATALSSADLRESAVSLETRTGYASGAGDAVRSGIYVGLAGRTRGDLLALRYRWNYSWDELSNLLSRDVTEAPEPSDLFRALTVVFHGTGSSAWPVVGAGGVAAADAEKAGALALYSSGKGVSIEMTVCLANVQGPGSSTRYAPQIIEGLLIVPDGTADGAIAGTMWMMEKAVHPNESAPNNGKGGGCDGVLGGLMLLFVLPLLRRRDPAV